MSIIAFSGLHLSRELSKLRMVWGTPELIIGVSHMGTCSSANFTEKAFPEPSSLVPVLFNTGTEKKYIWSWYCVGLPRGER